MQVLTSCELNHRLRIYGTAFQQLLVCEEGFVHIRHIMRAERVMFSLLTSRRYIRRLLMTPNQDGERGFHQYHGYFSPPAAFNFKMPDRVKRCCCATTNTPCEQDLTAVWKCFRNGITPVGWLHHCGSRCPAHGYGQNQSNSSTTWNVVDNCGWSCTNPFRLSPDSISTQLENWRVGVRRRPWLVWAETVWTYL